MTTTHPATARAEFEALCASTLNAREEWERSLDNPNKKDRDYADHKLKVIEGDLLHFVLDHYTTIAAALATPEPPAALPDDWRPRPDANGD